ncbi:hypothetical protein BCON_0271g00110 [Botryotinia convoluta]|uniref:ABM domain-containing protein n=1 Tax=Botryotinia convoluta TaxID=54673 RepID=A0A4Z1HLG1_9HELO|nr:hypothetical protein BCON_0271g00110 [Botryotinia convoluta]
MAMRSVVSGSGFDGPVTEMVRIGLRGEIGVGDLEGEGKGEAEEAARIWRETLDTVAAQKGCTNSYYGGTLEDEGVLIWCIDWTSLAPHKAFMGSPAYLAFLENLQPIMGSAEIIHVRKLDVAGAIEKGNAGQKGGVMEVATFFDVEDVFLEGVEYFKTAIRNLHAEKKIAGFLGVIDSGEVIEKIAKNKEAMEEEKGRALVIMIGWENKEAHMAFRETKEFADNIGYLRKGTSGADMFHIAFKNA